MRYNRHIILKEIGQEGQNKLAKTKVLVVGAGGLGCPILQYLAAAGVGTLGIIDFDVVEESNLQRQILFGNSSLGINKAIAAKTRLEDLNNSIIIKAYPEKLLHKNAVFLFSDYDIIVDGTDNFNTRYLINDTAIITNKPVVFGAIYKFEGQVSVFNYKDGPSYRCLFPVPPKNNIPNCSEVGVLGVLPGIIGTMQANEVLKIIIGIGRVLSGELLCYNALTLQTTRLAFQKNETEIKKVLARKSGFEFQKEEEDLCSVLIEKSIQKVIHFSEVQFVDVREFGEKPSIIGLKHLQIPLSELKNRISEISTQKEILFFCQSGLRSKKAVLVAQNLGVNNCYSCKEGAIEINEIMKNNSNA